MIQWLKQSIPARYRLIVFLTATSVIGVLLIFLAVYNASRELEIIHEVDNLHRFAEARLAGYNEQDSALDRAATLASDDYQLFVMRSGRLDPIDEGANDDSLPVDVAVLEQTRVNERGGYVELEEHVLTWAKLPLPGSEASLLFVHRFQDTGLGTLASVYSKRLLIPAAFYVWLMVWVALIIRFLTGKLHSQKDAMEHMALHDTLTGLPNRNLLADRLHKLIQDCRRQQRQFALILVDLNNFKEVNDTLGHEAGDELLRLVAQRLKDTLRASDTAARIGGDEFVLLLDGVDATSCVAMCERIESALAEECSLREAEITVGLSIGVALFPDHGEEEATLMRHADKAMYQAKAGGGGIRVYAGTPGPLHQQAPRAAAS